MIIPIYLAHIIPFISYHTIMIRTEQYKKHLEMLKKLDEKIKEQTGRSVFTHQIKQLERQKAEKKEEVNTKKK